MIIDTLQTNQEDEHSSELEDSQDDESISLPSSNQNMLEGDEAP